MSDSVIETPETTVTEEANESTATAPTLEELQAEVEKWKGFSRANEKRAKENLSAAQELQALKDAEKTELEKLTERAEKAEAELSTARLEAVRSRIAAKHGLTEEDVNLFLTAKDEEAIEAQAEALSARLNASTPETPKVNVNNSDLEGHPEPNSKDVDARRFFGL